MECAVKYSNPSIKMKKDHPMGGLFLCKKPILKCPDPQGPFLQLRGRFFFKGGHLTFYAD